MTTSEKVTEIAKILKQRFPNLTVEETIQLSFAIVDKIDNK